MKLRLTILSLLLAAGFSMLSAAGTRFAGGDISLMPAYEKAGALYLDYDGKQIQGSALDFFASQGFGIMRVRLFVNPANYNGPDKDPNACQNLEYITPICKQIKEKGLPLMLDFHYSDTWADPAKQWTPTDWVGLSEQQLYQKIYDYTRQTLLSLKEQGVTPDYIATGNEISYGMLWGAWDAPASSLKKCFMGNSANWPYFTNLLKQAGKACREVCPDAKIVLHTERVDKVDVQNNFYNEMKKAAVDYDVIGLSYYPYFHGPLEKLDAALSSLQTNFSDKEVMVVETGYPYKWEVPGTTYNYSTVYPYSETGQEAFTSALTETLKAHDNVTGVIWWWPEYNAYHTSLSGWYNAPLFDSLTGRALKAIKALAAYGTGASVEAVEADAAVDPDARWYDLQGRPLPEAPTAPGIYLHGDKKIMIR